MAKINADEELQNSLTSFESRLLNLLALMVVQERKQTEQISLLGRAGFRSTEIAALLGTTRNTVSVFLSQQKHEKKKPTTKKAK